MMLSAIDFSNNGKLYEIVLQENIQSEEFEQKVIQSLYDAR